MLPQDEYVVDIVLVKNWFQGCLGKYTVFQLTHEYIGVSWGQFGSHCCALYLFIVLIVEFKCIIFNTISKRHISTETSGLSGLLSWVEQSASLQASIPSLCGIQVYKELTSMMTRMVLGSIGLVR